MDPLSSVLLFVALSLLFQTCIKHKEAHYPSSIKILMGGLQVFLVWTWIWDGGGITCHVRILIPTVKVVTLLYILYYQFFLCEILWIIYIILWVNCNWSNIWYITLFEKLLSYCHFVSYQEIDSVLVAISIIGVYIRQLHHLVLYLISVSERITNMIG